MKHWIILVAIGLLAIPLAGPSLAQGPGRGFSSLLCLAEEVGFEIGNGQVSVSVDSDTVDPDGNGVAVVTITHGRTSSMHTIYYQDNGNGHLDCGDTITSVT